MSPWISVGALLLSLLTPVVAVTAVVVQMRASVATLSKDDDRREKREQEADKRRQDRERQLRVVATQFFARVGETAEFRTKVLAQGLLVCLRLFLSGKVRVGDRICDCYRWLCWDA